MWLRESGRGKEMQMVHSGWGDRSLNLLLQWTLTIIISNPATDKWMDTAPQVFCQGSCDPVDCMPIKKRILSIFLSASERVGLQWTEKEDTQMLFRFALALFFMEMKKIFIYKLRFLFFVPFESICFFFFVFKSRPPPPPFVHSVSQHENADTFNNALNVSHLGEKKDQKY